MRQVTQSIPVDSTIEFLEERDYIKDPEHRKKISESQKGKTLSDETKRKLSEAHKGKTCSDETRRKIAAARKGKTMSAEHRKKIADALKGKPRGPMRDETKRKIAAAKKGKPLLKRRNNWARISEEIEELYDNVWEGDEKYLSEQCIYAIQDHFKLKSKSTAWNYYKHWREEYDHNIILSSDIARYEHHAMNKENGWSERAKHRFAVAYGCNKFGELPEELKDRYRVDPQNSFKTTEEILAYYGLANKQFVEQKHLTTLQEDILAIKELCTRVSGYLTELQSDLKIKEIKNGEPSKRS